MMKEGLDPNRFSIFSRPTKFLVNNLEFAGKQEECDGLLMGKNCHCNEYLKVLCSLKQI